MDSPDSNSIQAQNQRTWRNFFSGIILFVVGFGVITLSQFFGIIILGIRESRETGIKPDEEAFLRLSQDGDLIGESFPIALIAVTLLVALVIKYRRKREIFDYLALGPRPLRAYLRWLSLAAALMLVNYFSGRLLGRPEVPIWMETIFVSVDNKLHFILGLAFFGPIMEEILYRGYVLNAWLESRLNPMAAVLLLSFFWALIHFQYDLYDMFWVFILGILLALSRIRTGSIYPAVVVHCCWNFAVYLQLELHFST